MTGKRPGNRVFGLVFAGLFTGISTVVWSVTGGVPIWGAAIATGLLATALVAPGWLMPINRAWSRLGMRIAALSNHVLLGAFYFGAVVPAGLMARAFRLIAIRKRPDPAAETYWTPVGRQANADTYPDLF